MEDKRSAKPILTSMEKGRGYEAKYAFDERMENTEYHCHDFYEIYIHRRGGQYFGLDSNLYLLKPNQVFIIPPFCMHGLSAASVLKNYERAYLNLSPEMLQALGCGVMDLDGFFRSYTAQGYFTFQLPEAEAGKCVDLIRRLNAPGSGDAADALDSLESCGLLIDLLHTLCRAIRRTQLVPGSVVPNSIILDVLTYINGNYTQPLKIDQLAKRFGISVSYLSHEFTRFTNRSVYDYVLYRRVMLARQLMQTDLSLNAIAYQCGFNDYSNFMRMFRKLVGTSPSQFRKELKKL